MAQEGDFFNLYNHNFVRLAAAIPAVRVADPAFNAAADHRPDGRGGRRRSVLVRLSRSSAFPGIPATTFSISRPSSTAAWTPLPQSSRRPRNIPVITVVGLPLRVDDLLFNCAAVVYGGKAPGRSRRKPTCPTTANTMSCAISPPPTTRPRGARRSLRPARLPFGTRLIFEVAGPAGPAVLRRGLRGPLGAHPAVVLCGPRRRDRAGQPLGLQHHRGEGRLPAAACGNQSARCIAAYLYTSAGFGESTTDLAWDGQAMIYENGTRLAESKRFSYEPQLVTADVDLDRLSRTGCGRTASASRCTAIARMSPAFRTVRFDAVVPGDRDSCSTALRAVSLRAVRLSRGRTTAATRSTRSRCRDLRSGSQFAGIDKVVIGVSGGLDSTQALIVAVRAMDVMGLPRTNIIACMLPGFATSERTMGQARRLIARPWLHGRGDRHTAVLHADVQGHRPPLRQGRARLRHHLRERPGGRADEPPLPAREPARALRRGDERPVELALGWCTYGVGDHMAHYHVNVERAEDPDPVPDPLGGEKGLLRRGEASAALSDVLDTG